METGMNVAVAVPFQSTVQLPFPERCFCDGHFVANP